MKLLLILDSTERPYNLAMSHVLPILVVPCKKPGKFKKWDKQIHEQDQRKYPRWQARFKNDKIT